MSAKDKRSNEQNAELHRLIGILHIDKETKQELVQKYTAGRETSSANLSYLECQELIKFLRTANPGEKVQTAENKMRRKIISHAYEIGWQNYNAKKRKMEADMLAINTWCNKYGQFHKDLNEHTKNELVKLVTQFEKLTP